MLVRVQFLKLAGDYFEVYIRNHFERISYIIMEVRKKNEFLEVEMINLKKTPWYLWPFAAVWNLVAYIVTLTGRLVAVILGLVFLIVGVILTITVVGAIVGIPLIVFGLLLVVRGLW